MGGGNVIAQIPQLPNSDFELDVSQPCSHLPVNTLPNFWDFDEGYVCNDCHTYLDCDEFCPQNGEDLVAFLEGYLMVKNPFWDGKDIYFTNPQASEDYIDDFLENRIDQKDAYIHYDYNALYALQGTSVYPDDPGDIWQDHNRYAVVGVNFYDVNEMHLYNPNLDLDEYGEYFNYTLGISNFDMPTDNQCYYGSAPLRREIRAYRYLALTTLLGLAPNNLLNNLETEEQPLNSYRGPVTIDDINICKYIDVDVQSNQISASCSNNEVVVDLNYNPSCYTPDNPRYIVSLINNDDQSTVFSTNEMPISTTTDTYSFIIGESGNYTVDVKLIGCVHPAGYDPNYPPNNDYTLTYDISTFCCDDCTDFTIVGDDGTDTETWNASNKGFGGQMGAGTITVPTGKTLIIDEDLTINFCQDAQLIIEEGAEVILKGKLTSCDVLWKGVVVKGNDNLNQDFSNQGLLKMRSHSIIENAIVGVTVEGGGILQTWKSAFHNNFAAAVKFEDYNHTASNKSYLANSNFLTDDNAFGMTQSFVQLEQTNRIKILYCSFTTTKSPIVQDNSDYYVGTGISASNSAFYVSKCDFNGLSRGIDMSAPAGADKQFTIKKSDFASCRIGILNTMQENGQITNNNFLLGNLPINTIQLDQFGLFMQGDINGITVEENDFHLSPNMINNWVTSTTGLYVQDLGEYSNQIRKNNFDGLLNANVAYGKNRDTGGSGLVYLCNDNTNIQAFNFAVEDALDQDFIGIDKNQGIPLSLGQYKSAGNLFSYNPATMDESDFYNHTPHFINYHYDQNGNPLEAPIDVTVPTADIGGVNIRPEADPKECATQYCNPPCFVDPPVETRKTGFWMAKGLWIENKALLKQNIENASSSTLLSSLTYANTSSAQSVINELLAASPYLSQDMIKLLMSKEDIFTEEQIKSVLLANPDVEWNTEMTNQLSGLVDGSTSNTININDVINNSNTTERSTVEWAIKTSRLEMDRASYDIIQHYKKDTVIIETDSILYYMQATERRSMDYKLAYYHFIQGDIEGALNMMQSISTTYEFNTVQEETYQNINNIYNAVAEYIKKGGNVADISTDNIPGLNLLSQEGQGVDRYYAWSLMRHLGQEPTLTYALPTLVQERAVFVSNKQQKSSAKSVIYPNPAQDYLFVDIKAIPGQIKVVDTQGHLVMDQKINDNILNISSLESGIYFYTIKTDTDVRYEGKLIVK